MNHNKNNTNNAGGIRGIRFADINLMEIEI